MTRFGWLLFDLLLASVLLAPHVMMYSSDIDHNLASFVFFVTYGFITIMSNRWKKFSKTAYILWWISEYPVTLRTKRNYMYFGLIFVLASFLFLFLEPRENQLDTSLQHDPLQTAVLISIFVLVNFAYGKIREKRAQKDK